MRKLTLNAALVTAATLGWGSVAQAAELSLVSGFFRTEEREVADADAGKKTTIDVGGRFSEQLDGQLFWFGQGMLTLKSYDKGDVGDAPSDSTSLNAGGGIRYYFAKLSENVSPFAYGVALFKNEKDGSATGVSIEETETNGLFYGAHFGIRLGLGTDFFVDFETQLFESALFANETTETETVTATGTTKSQDETKKTELYVNTTGALQSCVIALGMRL